MNKGGEQVKKLVLSLLILSNFVFSSNNEVWEYLAEEWRWVKVKNPYGIKNHDTIFFYNETCGIRQGNSVRVISEKRNHYLIKYTSWFDEISTSCPSGTVFLISKKY